MKSATLTTALRIDHPEVGDRVDPDGDVVPGDDLLGGHIHRYRAQVDLDHALDERDQQDQAGPAHTGQPPEPEDDAPLVLLHDLDRAQKHDHGKEEDDAQNSPDHLLAFPARGIPPLSYWNNGSGVAAVG